jgi:cobalt/nickel transport system permease protein
MHISEGILPVAPAFLTGLVALPFIAAGLMRINKLKAANPLYFSMIGLTGAVVFVLSAFPIPVPFAGTCSHPAGTGLSAIFLGPLPSVVVAFVSLLIQAMFMAHGGLTTIGANTLTMGVCGSFCAFMAFRTSRRARISFFWSGFAAGLVADLVTYAATAFVLAVSIAPDYLAAFTEIALAFVPTQIPLSILEGVITGYAVRYVHQHKPELLERL